MRSSVVLAAPRCRYSAQSITRDLILRSTTRSIFALSHEGVVARHQKGTTDRNASTCAKSKNNCALSSRRVASTSCRTQRPRSVLPPHTTTGRHRSTKGLTGLRLFSTPTEADFKTSSESKVDHEQKQQDKKSKSLAERFKDSKLGIMWSKYGYVAIGTYGGLYVGTLALIYAALKSDVLCKGDTIWFVKSLGLDNFFESRELATSKGNFAVAWVMTKFTEPLRMAVTVAVVPWITRTIMGRREAQEAQQAETTPEDSKKQA